MSDVRQALERGVEGVAPPTEWFERMLRRRDRKRRRQRITAAAVGIAFALIAVLVGTRVWPSASVPVHPTPTITQPVQPPVANTDVVLVRNGVISVVRPDGTGLRKLALIPGWKG